jgi:hypothetical protein
MKALFARTTLLAMPVLAALSAPALGQTAEAGMRAWVASLDASPDWSAGFQQITTEGGRTTVVTGLTIAQEKPGGLKLRFDPIRVTGYAEPSGGGFSADDITLAGATIEIGGVSLKVGQVKASQFALPSTAGFRFDGDKPFSSMVKAYGVIANARFTQASIDRLEFNETVLGTTSAFSQGPIALGKLADGKLESIAGGPMQFDGPSKEGLVRFGLERFEAQRIDFNALIKVYDPDQYVNGVGDGVWQTVYGLASYRNLSFEVPGASFRVASATAEDLRMRQPPKPFMPYLDTMTSQPNASRDQQNKAAVEYLINILYAVGVGRMSFEGMDVSGTGLDRFRIGQFYLRNVSADGLGEISLSDMRVAVAGEASVDLGRIAFGDITFPKLATIRTAMDAAERGLDVDRLGLVPTLGFFEMNALAVAIPDQGRVALDRLRLDLGGFIGPIPTAIDFDTRGLQMDLASVQNPRVRKILTDLGYSQLSLDERFNIRWNEANESLSVNNFVLAAKGAGSIGLDFQLAGLQRSAFVKLDQLADAIMRMVFTGGQLTVQDDSLVNRIIDMLAKQQGKTSADLRKEFTGALPFMLMMLRNPGFQAKLTPVIQAFIQNPGKLVFTAKPKNPVPVTAIISTLEKTPEKAIDLLAVDVGK